MRVVQETGNVNLNWLDFGAPIVDTDTDTDSDIVGATPPMGWNSWNTFACNGLNESVVRATADAFISSGMAAAGYQYVNLDDCWMDGRDSTTGRLKWDTSSFPSGIPALAEYIHSLGLKIGIYTTPNHLTCTGLYGNDPRRVGSLGYEDIDAQTFAEWGIDYLKYDLCAGDMASFIVMRDALRATGRPIFYSINPANQGPFCTPTYCATAPPGLDFNLTEVANMWRIEMDIWDGWNEVLRCIDANKDEYIGAGPGHWNDPDMLEVGNPGLSDAESRAHFSMWAIMASPLIAGNDVTQMSPTTIETLTNAEVIAVNQDPLGYQGRVVATPGGDVEVWSKDLSEPNTRAVALFNRGAGSSSITVQWSDIGLPSGAASVRDLWAHQDLGSFTDSFTMDAVAGHTVVMLKIVSTN
ncbi:MAG: glycoside hydrolase family 27 protein [Deltaproteobacteria bacterium]|nr:glycoside hydrolase family 27 protein [Deltaproteobacteria bacterium]MBN2671229.1 glycoside hydrolase family 27 protein [Deltaproteobacteria bacterium]